MKYILLPMGADAPWIQEICEENGVKCKIVDNWNVQLFNTTEIFNLGEYATFTPQNSLILVAEHKQVFLPPPHVEITDENVEMHINTNCYCVYNGSSEKPSLHGRYQHASSPEQ